MVAAMGENRVIGAKGAIPWKQPTDQARFKTITMGKPVIMGATTFDSMGRPLPGRLNIVMSRTPRVIEGATVVDSVEEALAAVAAVPEAMIVGGGQIYTAFLPLADAIELTVVHASPAGDAYFPELNPNDWNIVHREEHVRDERNEFDYSFLRYERVS